MMRSHRTIWACYSPEPNLLDSFFSIGHLRKNVNKIKLLKIRDIFLFNNMKKTRSDYIEMIIDWECARFTKPDKPLDAYQTMKKFYPDLESRILPLMIE